MRVPDELRCLRDEVARLDDALLTLLAERLSVARRIGAVKRREGLPVCDPAREARVVRRAAERARSLSLPEDEVRELAWRVVRLARGVQRPPG